MSDTPMVRILLVDDDDVDVRAIQRGLKRRGVDNPLTVARDGVGALEILRGDHEHDRLRPPYLVLMDLKMPRMNGLGLLKEIRSDKRLASTVVFVLSTSRARVDVEEAYRRNVAGYLVKSDLELDGLDMIERYVRSVQFPVEECV